MKKDRDRNEKRRIRRERMAAADRFIDALSEGLIGPEELQKKDFVMCYVDAKELSEPRRIVLDAHLAHFGERVPGYSEAHRELVSGEITQEVVDNVVSAGPILMLRSWCAATADTSIADVERFTVLHRLMALAVIEAFSKE